MGVILQFAEERVLLGQQNFNVLHTYSDYPGADIWLESVDALVGERRDQDDTSCARVMNADSLQVRCPKETSIIGFRCELCRAAHARETAARK